MDFNDLFERFGKLPRVQRLAAMLVILVLLVASFWTVLYAPKSEELVQLEAKNRDLVSQKEQVRQRAENREKFEAELEELTTALRQALRELPNDREIPELLKRISSVGKKVGLEIRRFQPLPESPREYYADVPVALEVVGAYHEVAMFFDRLSKLGRIVYVKNVEIKGPEERGGKVYLKVIGTSVTFRFLSDDELNASGGKRGGKRGKRGKR